MIKLSKSLCVAVALLSSSAAWANDSGWAISETDGQVSIIRGGQSVYGAEGTRLQIGDVVRTSKSGRAVLARGDKFVVVTSKSQVRIKPAKQKGKIMQMVEYMGDKLQDLTGSSGRRSSDDTQVMAAVVKGYGDKPAMPASGDLEGSMSTFNPGE
ncbi:MAG: hypothetical protein ABJ242_09085 [Marinomonas sp.]